MDKSNASFRRWECTDALLAIPTSFSLAENKRMLTALFSSTISSSLSFSGVRMPVAPMNTALRHEDDVAWGC